MLKQLAQAGKKA